MVVAGLILAAFFAWKLSVINEIRSTMKPESKNTHGLMLGFCPLDLQSEYLIENDNVGIRYLKGEIHNFYFVYY
jgi:hypothetical protein